MKKLLLLIMPLFFSFLFTGCIQKVSSFKQDYVNYDSVEYISNKIYNSSIVIDNSDVYEISKLPNTIILGRGIKSTINSSFVNNTLQSVLLQYYKNVSLSNNISSEIVIKVKLLDYVWEPIFGGQRNKFKILCNVYLKDKLILNKTYEEEFDSRNLIGSLSSMDELVDTIKSKHLFELYQTKFIPDLAKALKENM